MPAYQNFGIRLVFPNDWHFDEEANDETTTITVHDEGAAFWSVALLWNRPPVEDVIAEIEATFREEYEQVDIDASQQEISGRMAECRQIDFFCLELVNTALVRAFRTGRFTVLILAQATDHELITLRPVFDEITRSLNVDLDGDIVIE